MMLFRILRALAVPGPQHFDTLTAELSIATSRSQEFVGHRVCPKSQLRRCDLDRRRAPREGQDIC